MLTVFLNRPFPNKEWKMTKSLQLKDGDKAPGGEMDLLNAIEYVSAFGKERQYACFLTSKQELDRVQFFFGDDAKYIVANWG